MNKILISCKESRIENNRSFYGCFYLGPFDASQSLTVANALRRTLLSECPGLGITSVIIENVHHEYSTLPNVRDSVLDILLNLKEIVLKKASNPWNFYQNQGLNSLYEDVGSSYFKPVVGYLKVKGPGVIRAKNLRLPPFIQCVDPDQYIATLTDDGILNMKFIVMEGKNYFIQKSNSFLDLTFPLPNGKGWVKKRENLLKELKDLLNSSTGTGGKERSSASKEGANNQVLTSANNYNWGLARSPLGKKDSKTQQKVSRGSLGSFSSQGPKGNKKKDFQNASVLNIDAIFNPVTKVNYILEVSENQLAPGRSAGGGSNLASLQGGKNSIEKMFFIDDITSLINSNAVIKKNFPFLKTAFLPKGPHSSKNEQFEESSLHKIDSLGMTSTEDPILKDETSEDIHKLNPLMKGLLEYVDNFSTSEFGEMYNSLHPLKKGSSKHNIILEIWTNGSMHPRDALSNAFFNLSFLFLNLQKTKILSPIYRNSFSFKQSLNILDGNDSPLASSRVDEASSSIYKKNLLSVTNSLDLGASLPSAKGGKLPSNMEDPSLQPLSYREGGKDNKKEGLNLIQNLNYDIRLLNLSLRTYTKLKRANLNNIGDLSTLNETQLLKIVDKKSLFEIKRNLLEIGLDLPPLE